MRKLHIFLIVIILSLGVYWVWFKQSTLSPYELYKNEIPYTYRLGLTSLEQEIIIDKVSIMGHIPAWLSGTLFRNGPAKFTQGSNWVSNWFDGLAMIHAFSFHDGKVSYANKFLRSDDYDFVEKTGTMSYAGFAQDPCKSYFKQLFSLFVPEKKIKKEYALPNANVNIACYGHHMVALTETPLPIEFDPKTLKTIGGLLYDDKLPKRSIHDTAHPHYDKERKEHLGYYSQFGRISTHNLFRIQDGSTTREVLASIEVQEPSYMHSFFLTEHYAILTLLPLVVNPLDLLTSKKSFIKNFRWKPELGTKLVVIDRINNKIQGSYNTHAFFAFHTVNAFEQGDSLIMDIVTYPDGSGIGQAKIATIFEGKNPGNLERNKVYTGEPDTDILEVGQLNRLTVNLSSATVAVRTLYDNFIELPRINYEHYNTKQYSYIYAYGKKYAPLFVADRLVKVNVNTGKSIEWWQEHCYPGEPIFVAAPSLKSEDDGVILSVVLDTQKQTSFLLVLDGETFKELARAYVPHHIPFGIHGLFMANSFFLGAPSRG
ncbi:MAG: carotenoid oxygenase family protein [Candidatus Babeliales bacterium]